MLVWDGLICDLNPIALTKTVFPTLGCGTRQGEATGLPFDPAEADLKADRLPPGERDPAVRWKTK